MFQRLRDQIDSHASPLVNPGSLHEVNARAKAVGICGDSLEVQLSIHQDRITEIKQIPNGCTYTVACGSAMSHLVRGLSLEEALNVTPEDVATQLGNLPEDHMHCASLAVNALGEAIDDYYQKASGKAQGGY
jgi:nitrogen fixation NifU-like protein